MPCQRLFARRPVRENCAGSMHGQADDKGDALVGALCGNVPAVQLHDFSRNGQTQTCAAGGTGARIVQAEKLIEDARQLVGGNGLAVVLHPEMDFRFSLRHGEQNFRIWIAVVHRIADQIVKHALQLVRVAQ